VPIAARLRLEEDLDLELLEAGAEQLAGAPVQLTAQESCGPIEHDRLHPELVQRVCRRQAERMRSAKAAGDPGRAVR
jgi:hypothetical protein